MVQHVFLREGYLLRVLLQALLLFCPGGVQHLGQTVDEVRLTLGHLHQLVVVVLSGLGGSVGGQALGQV